MLVETDIERGLRWGELTELRVKDLDFRTRILTVSRAVIEVTHKFHPEGGRFLVKDYHKDKEYRRLKLGAQVVRKLRAHVEAGGAGESGPAVRDRWPARTPVSAAVGARSACAWAHRAKRQWPTVPARHAACEAHTLCCTGQTGPRGPGVRFGERRIPCAAAQCGHDSLLWPPLPLWPRGRR